MVREFTKTMLEKYETVNFTLTLSQVFEDLYSADANFEMASSNTVQPLKMFYRYNIVTHKIGVIFVHGTKLDRFIRKGIKPAKDLLKEHLEFDDVTIWKDLSKA